MLSPSVRFTATINYGKRYLMQLADFQIRALAQNSRMISPFSDQQLQSFGFDMTIARNYKKFRGTNKLEVLDIGNFKEEYFEDCVGDYIRVEPHNFVLGMSVEYFKIPKNIIGLCVSRSSLARCGVFTPITPLEPGWSGFVTIEIFNTGTMPIKIPAKTGIAQVLFLESQHFPWRDYTTKDGRYNKQEGIVLSKGV
jgi:dCTP deaminase